MAVTVGHLLATDIVAGVEVVGGAESLNRTVRSVVRGTTPDMLRHEPAGSVVVFADGGILASEIAAEIAARSSAAARHAAVLFTRRGVVAPITLRRLGDRLGLPIVLVDGFTTHDGVAELDRYARAPQLSTAKTVRLLLQSLPEPGRPPSELLTTLRSLLRCRVAIVDPSARVVRGDEILEHATPTTALLGVLGSGRPVPRTADLGKDVVAVVQPIPAEGAGTNLWLAARIDTGGEDRLETVRQCLALAAWPFAMEIVSRSLTTERAGRERALLLTEILENPGEPSRETVERATALGWRLSGWHTAVSVAQRGEQGTVSAAALESALADAGLTLRFVERPTGWVGWQSSELQPDASAVQATVAQVTACLRAIDGDFPTARLCAGVGLSRPGPGGIGQSIRDAEAACLMARSRIEPAAVEHSDPTSVRRLLLGWLGDDSLREAGSSLLDPLHDADASGQMLATLGAYLENRCSATAASAALGIHRNTVLQRLTRITDLLDVDLDSADDRLALQLAARLVRAGPR